MDCKTAHEQLSAYLDGALPREVSVHVTAHVRSCPRCADELVRLRQLDRLLDEAPAARTPEGFPASVRQAAEDAGDAARKVIPLPARRYRIVARVAAMVALALGVSLGALLGTWTGRVHTSNIAAAQAPTPDDLATQMLSIASAESPTGTYLRWMGETE
jgi:anti-sigma factor RsiW